ncbi:MAG: universal stress protein [Acidobacteriota bacterium]|nr:universal stress protein [Acidobacteriota bacterium]
MSKYNTVLATTDFSEAASAGVLAAADLAEALDADLKLIYVAEDRMPPLGMTTEQQRKDIRQRHEDLARESLDKLAAKLLGDKPVEAILRIGNPAAEIVACADEVGADFIVMATRGFGSVGQMIFGSTTQKVLHNAQCPVISVRSSDD